MGGKAGKPRPDFPLFAHARGYWAKKVRGRLVYFGKVADDPKGKATMPLRTMILLGLNCRLGNTDAAVGRDFSGYYYFVSVAKSRVAWVSPAYPCLVCRDF